MDGLCRKAISHELFSGQGSHSQRFFQLFSGPDLMIELLRSFALDVRVHLGGVQRLIFLCVGGTRPGLLVAVLAGRGAFTFTSWFPCAVVAVKRLPGREEAWPARRCSRRGAGPGERRRGLLVARLGALGAARSRSRPGSRAQSWP